MAASPVLRGPATAAPPAWLTSATEPPAPPAPVAPVPVPEPPVPAPASSPPDPAGPGTLGPGERDLGVAPHAGGRNAISERDPDAGGDGQVRVPDPERLGGDAARQPFCNVREFPGVRRALGEDRELITAPAGHRVLR